MKIPTITPVNSQFLLTSETIRITLVYDSLAGNYAWKWDRSLLTHPDPICKEPTYVWTLVSVWDVDRWHCDPRWEVHTTPLLGQWVHYSQFGSSDDETGGVTRMDLGTIFGTYVHAPVTVSYQCFCDIRYYCQQHTNVWSRVVPDCWNLRRGTCRRHLDNCCMRRTVDVPVYSNCAQYDM